MTAVLRVSLSAFVLLAGGVWVTLLAPGGLGNPQPELVTGGVSADVYRATLNTVPGWLSGCAVAGLLALAALLAWAGRRRPARLVLAGVGAVVAYLGSEAIKLVVDEERPCRALAPVDAWLPCPPVGDWSFPSNHATVAGALAAGLIMIAPRLAVLAVPLALLVAVARVAGGVHYPHDVLAGLLLGTAVTVALLLSAGPVADRLAGRYVLALRRAP